MENKKRILAIGLFISLIVVFLAVNILEAAPAVYIETHPFFLLLCGDLSILLSDVIFPFSYPFPHQ